MTKFSPLSPTDAPADLSPPKPLSGLSVLVVDDSTACRMVEAAMIRALGADAKTAETAVETLARTAVELFDLIILDIGLADVDGRVLTRTLRETPNGAQAAILCVSGLGGDARASGALNAGADGFAEKPFASLSSFSAAAKAALDRRVLTGEEVDAVLEEEAEPLSPRVTAYAAQDLSRGRARILSALSEGDVAAARRAAHFISGVASLIGDAPLYGAARSLEIADGDAGALRAVETVLSLAHEAERALKAQAA